MAEQLRRLAGVEWEGEVEEVKPTTGWRTRVRYHRGGMHRYRSDEVVPLPAGGCLIAAPGLERPPASAPAEILGVAAADGVHWVAPGDGRLVREEAAGRSWHVRADGFWQVHPNAADVLVDTVWTGLAPRPGESALDLYCGVGLFSGALSDAGLRVTGVEGSRTAVALAERNVPAVSFVAGDVGRALTRLPGRCDLVVVDPPRKGAGASVIGEVVRREPRAIAYVACDPAALARDLGTLAEAGYGLVSLRAFDLFPMTHHVECVAIVEPNRRRR